MKILKLKSSNIHKHIQSKKVFIQTNETASYKLSLLNFFFTQNNLSFQTFFLETNLLCSSIKPIIFTSLTAT